MTPNWSAKTRLFNFAMTAHSPSQSLWLMKLMTRTMNGIARTRGGSKLYRAALKLLRAGDENANWPKAFSMMSEAASLGETIAIAALAGFFDYGVGTKQDSREAFRLYKIAAERGLADAQFNVAMCFMDGAGTRKNRPRGVSLLRVLAEPGTPPRLCTNWHMRCDTDVE